MLISKKWLQEYIEEKLPSTEMLVETLSLHAFEVEGVNAVGDDEVLDIDVLPNRAHDALGYLGVAREVCTLLNLTFKNPSVEFDTDDDVSSAEMMTLTVEDSKLVPRAMKRLVVDIAVGESPDWLKEKLTAMGQKSINNIVDATNFVTFETNQPVHAFDYDKLAGDKKSITIRGAKAGEEMNTLDGDLYKLEEGMLVIADDDKALDIAGIKGGNNSGIDENTKRIVLSVCNFNQSTIRKTSRALGLVTDASKRFGQGISPELTSIAMERLSQLMHELAGGKVAEDVLDVYPRPPHGYKVGVSVEGVNKLLGLKLSEKDITKILDRLGFSHEKVKNPIASIMEIAPTLEGRPYKYGASIIMDAPECFDCSAFTAYLFVQVGIGIPRMTVDQYVFGKPIDKSNLQQGDLVFSLNATEDAHIHHKSKEFLPGTSVDDGVDHVGMYIGDGRVVHASGNWDKGKIVIENLKDSVGFKKVIGYRRVPGTGNSRLVVTVPHERLDIRIKQDLIEEIGRVYGYQNIKATIPKAKTKAKVNKEFYYVSKIRDILVSEGFYEVYTYTFAKEGDVEVKKPMNREMPFLRNRLSENIKNIVENGEHYKDLLGVESVQVFEIGKVFEKESEKLILSVAGNEKKVTKALESLENIIGKQNGGSLVEIDLGKALEKLSDPDNYSNLEVIDSNEVQFKSFSQYPFVLRDIAVWVPEDTDKRELLGIIQEKAGKLLVNTTLFDEYKKDKRVSYAYRLVFQSYEKTLSDEEVNTVMEKINSTIEKKGWKVR